MVRLKSIDNFRGITIIAMIWLHLSEWWLSGEAHWFGEISLVVVNYVFWVSFQFISRMSTFLFYKTRNLSKDPLKSNTKKTVKKEFALRALLLFILSLIYNGILAITTLNPLTIWTLFMILSIAMSLIMTWPLLETSKWTRLFLGIFFMVTNFILLSLLQGFKGQINIFGAFYHFLFFPINLHPILSSFAAFLIGTIYGDIIFDIYNNDDKFRRRRLLKRRIIVPSLIIGGILIAFVFTAQSAQSAQFLSIPSLYHIISSLGISLILFSLFVIIEEYKIFKTKKSYKFVFYYSYYSLTIYIAHNLLFFLFWETLNIPILLIFLVITIIL